MTARVALATSRGMIAALVAGIVITLGGCAEAGSALPASVVEQLGTRTLAESKSSVQLLRNEAAGRLPRIVMNSAVETIDISVPCLAPGIDPAGLARSWNSSTTILITNSRAASIHEATIALVASFVEQGWEAADEGGTGTHSVLASEKTDAVISITASDRSSDDEAAITIDVTGSCVLTAGPESQEVLLLEGRG